MTKVGFYTEVAGLEGNPADVVINEKIEVYNQCFGVSCFALTNFWRALSNLSIKNVSLNQDACWSQEMFWAVSQASPMRRVDIFGVEVSLMDYCTKPGYASGWFIADSRGTVIHSGGQQQFLTRNSDISSWDGGVWNQMFLGVRGAPEDSVFPQPPYTTIETNPLGRENPYLFISDAQLEGIEAYSVHVLNVAQDSNGISWGNGILTPGRTIPLREFFIVKSTTTVAMINEALSAGKHLLFSPGVSEIYEAIVISNADTPWLGSSYTYCYQWKCCN
jgi:hypothetical protein